MTVNYELKSKPTSSAELARFEISKVGQDYPQMQAHAEQPNPNGNCYLYVKFIDGTFKEGEPHYGHRMLSFVKTPEEVTQKLHDRLLTFAMEKLLDKTSEEEITLEDTVSGLPFTNQKLS
jgi:hypothetical protein